MDREEDSVVVPPHSKISRDRDSAKLAAAKKWADHRRRKKEESSRLSSESSGIDGGRGTPSVDPSVTCYASTLAATTGTTTTTKPLAPPTGELDENIEPQADTASNGNVQPPISPPLCVLLRKYINDITRGIHALQLLNGSRNSNKSKENLTVRQEHNKQQHAEPRNVVQSSNSASSSASVATTSYRFSSKRSSFPSVLSILEANALTRHVESIQEEQEQEEQEAGYQGNKERKRSLSMSVLPADYDFQKALQKMTESRSRAFLLLDLSAIIRSHTTLRKHLPKKDVKITFSTRHNTNARFLKLLKRIGVELRVSTSYDYDVVKQVCPPDDDDDDEDDDHSDNDDSNSTTAAGTTAPAVSVEKTNTVWDDCTVPCLKPRSFYRRLIFRDDNTSRASPPPIAVDNPDDIGLIYSQLLRIWKRKMINKRKTVQSPPLSKSLSFLLRLIPTESIETWKLRYKELSAKCIELDLCLVGFSLDLNGLSNKDRTHNLGEGDGGNDTSSNTIQSTLKGLTALITFVKSNSSHHQIMPQVHLTVQLDSTRLDDDIVRWVRENSSSQCSLITIDVSRLLVMNAAALCARIIGVKHDRNQRVHYYIDDGRYGLLSNYPNVGQPLPLRRVIDNDNHGNISGNGNDSKQQRYIDGQHHELPATVWGPTCDGLDKVCGDIVLPATLSRDDWLVFPDLGFCHVGTSFNGFSPPDIACCVLGGQL